MTYWLFEGNPKYYRIIDGIGDFEQMPWLATRYAKEMAAGDGVLPGSLCWPRSALRVRAAMGLAGD